MYYMKVDYAEREYINH